MRAVLEIRKEPYYRREAFERGLRFTGFDITHLPRPSDSSDWLILWNRKRGSDEQRADAWEAAGGTVIVAENGYLARTEKTHYAISVHGHNGSGWFPVGDEDRFSKLGFELKRWRTNGSEIVVREQRGIGSVQMASPPQWGRQTTEWLRRTHPTAAVRLVPHPGDKNKAAIDEANLKRASVLVIWSSAMGVRALVEGIPVLYAAPRWVCSGAAARWTTDLNAVHCDYTARNEAMHRMSHGQWHFDEIATGEPFARIIAERGKATW